MVSYMYQRTTGSSPLLSSKAKEQNQKRTTAAETIVTATTQHSHHLCHLQPLTPQST